MNRLKSGSGSGFFDGLYLIGNAPVVLCEIKRYDGIDAPAAFESAKQQLIDYARSEDFAEPPPFLVFYCGKPERTRFFVRKTVSEWSLLSEPDYEELDEIWSWERVKEFQLRGAFALEVVHRDRLRQILLYHLDRIEDDLRPQVNPGDPSREGRRQPRCAQRPRPLAAGAAGGARADAPALRAKARRDREADGGRRRRRDGDGA